MKLCLKYSRLFFPDTVYTVVKKKQKKLQNQEALYLWTEWRYKNAMLLLLL